MGRTTTINWKWVRKAVLSKTVYRGAISIAAVIAIWELGARFHLPILGAIPAPSDVMAQLGKIILDPSLG